MIGILIICGESGSGKTTIGRIVAQKLRYSHWEMSKYVLDAQAEFELDHGKISTADFVERVLWAEGRYDVAASRLVAFLSTLRNDEAAGLAGVVVTGPRRYEEIDAILALDLPTAVVYLEVPFRIRLKRVGRKEGKGDSELEAGLAARNRREAEWGLLQDPARANFLVVSNVGSVMNAVNQIVSIAHRTLPRGDGLG